MSNRRTFLAATTVLGLTATRNAMAGADTPAIERQLYELRRYDITGAEQKAGLDAFFRDAAIPAWNRAGINPVGVFYPETDLSPIYVLLPHKNFESVLTCTQKLLGNAEYLEKGAAVLNAPASAPAFGRVESSLLLAFKGMPCLETPVKNAGRVVQLRTYESPSVKTGQKKIEMFNDAGEIPLFRRVGLHPVFFGEAVVGDKLPNLTYMLIFESKEQLDANWKTFINDPEWKVLSKKEEYSDKAILSHITNLILKPAEYSQI